MTEGLYLCGAVVGYCMGCLEMAWFLGFLHDTDIKKCGTGNAGASNAFISLGPACGILTAAWDIGKAAGAYSLLKCAFQAPENACLLAAGATVLGHIFPFWLDFNGGKGLAPYIGLLLCMDWEMCAAVLLAGALLAVWSDRMIALTGAVIISGPFIAYQSAWWPGFSGALILSGIVLWRHWANLSGIARGTEPGIRSVVSGAFRSNKKE